LFFINNPKAKANQFLEMCENHFIEKLSLLFPQGSAIVQETTIVIARLAACRQVRSKL
jgi:hypothetical protein